MSHFLRQSLKHSRKYSLFINHQAWTTRKTKLLSKAYRRSARCIALQKQNQCFWLSSKYYSCKHSSDLSWIKFSEKNFRVSMKYLGLMKFQFVYPKFFMNFSHRSYRSSEAFIDCRKLQRFNINGWSTSLKQILFPPHSIKWFFTLTEIRNFTPR